MGVRYGRRGKGPQGSLDFARRTNLKAGLHGDEQVRELLYLLGEATERKRLQAATNFAMTPVLNAAKRNAPVSSEPHDLPRRKGTAARTVFPGFLARHVIKRKAKFINVRRVGTFVGMESEAWYGVFQETGTSWFPAQPWLRRSFYENRHEVKRRYNQKLWRDVRKLMPGVDRFLM